MLSKPSHRAGRAPVRRLTLLYLEARLWGEKGDWQKAWQAMAKYLDQL